ncbi:MAG: YdcF family protein [Gemmatimonadaceae bacterium]
MTGRRPRWRALSRVLMVTACAWLASIALVIIWGVRDEAAPADAIIVLGAAQWDGRPSPVLRARLEHAYALWSEGHAPWLVVTGGVGAGDTTSEAVVGKRFLTQLGVPVEKVLMEAEGRTTEQSMRGVAAMLKSRGISSVLLVSDPFHMLRLDVVARSHGLVPHTSPTRTSPISRNIPELVTYVLAESIKVPFTLVAAAAAWAGNAIAR